MRRSLRLLARVFRQFKVCLFILLMAIGANFSSIAFAADTWEDVSAWPDPVTPIIDNFKQQIASKALPEPTGLTSDSYLDTLELLSDYFVLQQNTSGSVRGAGGTVCFAQMASIAAVKRQRWDLLEPAALALDWVTTDLAYGNQSHSDFQATRGVNAMLVLEPYVDPNRSDYWRTAFASYDPYTTYAYVMGGSNWNMIALSGEMKLYHLGLRDNFNYVEESVEANGYRMTSHWGFYQDPKPSSAYDLFARIWVSDMITWGYEGSRSDELKEIMRRGSLTSLLAQSPSGQFPAGNRRSPFHWPDGSQAAIFEMYANKALQDGDTVLAGIYKRAARNTLAQIQKWVVPGSEGIITKNLFPPEDWFGLEDVGEGYNLTMGSMLVMAYQHSLATESVTEQWTPSEAGSYVIYVEGAFGRIFANAGGMYVQLETNADPSFDPTGLLRVHKIGCDPELGPSNGILSSSTYQVPTGPRTTAAVGPAWKDASGNWHRLAEYSGGSISNVELQNVVLGTDFVSFDVVYTGSFDGVSQVKESYTITPENVHTISRPLNYTGPVRFYWPILVDNGKDQGIVSVSNSSVTWTLGGNSQRYKAVNADTIWVSDQLYPGRNGWSKLAYAEFQDTVEMFLAFDLIGDFNNDNNIDEHDLVQLCVNWLGTNPNVDIYPVGGDGIIDIYDFGFFSSKWTGPDLTAPSPATMTWESPPSALSSSTIEMTATKVTDDSGVEYYFNNVTDPNHDSGWQMSSYYKDAGLDPSTQYTYRVVAHDLSVNQNMNTWSTEASAITPAFVHTTIFETCSSNPTSNGWINSQGGSTIFSYNAVGYIDAAMYKQSTPARYYKQLPGYDKSTEFWWEFDSQFLSSSGTWGNGILGVFADVSGDYEFVGTRLATKKTAGNRYDLWYQTPSSAYSLFIGPDTIPDNTSVRIKGHYWYTDGVGYAEVEVYNISSGTSYGSTGVQTVLTDASSFLYTIFGIGNRTDGVSSATSNAKIDNLYFSTQEPNPSPVPPSF